MSIKLDKKLFAGRKQVEVYTKPEIDELLFSFKRLTERASSIKVSGGSSSVGSPASDHGQLSGLGDDDHPQYLTEGRGDQRYLSIEQRLFTDSPITGGGILDDDLTIGIDYNNRNLRNVSDELDTIQNIDRNANVEFKTLDLDEGLTIDDELGYVNSETFFGGFGGNGTQLKNYTEGWTQTVDNLVVRKTARFYELIVEKVRANGGTIVVSPGAEKITSAEQVGDASWSWGDNINPFAQGATNSEGIAYSFADQYECFIEEDKYITIDVDDLVWRQQWTGRGTGVTEGKVFATETGSATETNNDPPRSFTMWIRNSSQPPQEGHDFAVIGNTTDPARQNGIIITASDIGNPYRRVYAGVDSFEAFGSQETIKGQDGRLDNIVTPKFADLDGTQQNLYGAYWDGNFYVNDGHFRGVVEITDPDASNAATKGYVDGASGDGTVIIISDSEPQNRNNGDDLRVNDTWLDSSNGRRPHNWDGNQWIRQYTKIDGGDLVTGSVEANKLNIGSVKDIDSDAAIIDDVITDYNELNGKPSLGTVAELDEISSTYMGDGAVVTRTLAANAVTANEADVNSFFTVDAEVNNVLSLPGGMTKIGKGIYNSPTIGPQDGIITAGGGALLSDQGMDLDINSGTAGEIEWHDTDVIDDLTSNSNLVGELGVTKTPGFYNFTMRAQASGGRDSRLQFTGTEAKFSINSFEMGGRFVGSETTYNLTENGPETVTAGKNVTTVVLTYSSGTREVDAIDGTSRQILFLLNKTGDNVFLNSGININPPGGNQSFRVPDDSLVILYNYNGIYHIHTDLGQ